MPEKKIKYCSITPLPVNLMDPLPEVHVKYDDGTLERLFDFYPDEISFTEQEFIGLTRTEAINLKYKKDLRYLMEASCECQEQLTSDELDQLERDIHNAKNRQ